MKVYCENCDYYPGIFADACNHPRNKTYRLYCLQINAANDCPWYRRMLYSHDEIEIADMGGLEGPDGGC